MSSENCCPPDVICVLCKKMVKKRIALDTLMIRLVRRDERHVRSGGSNIVQV